MPACRGKGEEAIVRFTNKNNLKELFSLYIFRVGTVAVQCKTIKNLSPPVCSHNHRLSRWLAQPYKGMVPAGLKAL